MAKTKKTKTVKPALTPAVRRQKKLTKKQQNQVLKTKVKKLPKLPSSFKLAKDSFSFFKLHWRTMLGLATIYIILNIVLVRGINGGVDVSGLKDSLNQAVGNGNNQLSSAFSVFGSLLGSSGTSSGGQTSLLQSLLLIYESLVLIWVYRQIFSGNKVRIKQAYYNSTGQLVPFFLVLIVLIIQSLPLVISSTIYQLVVSNGLDNTLPEKIFWIGQLLVGVIWTLRMLSASVFSLYIVTLPAMLPVKAVRSAIRLVRFRRLLVIRRLIFLAILILVLMGLVVIPLIIYAAPLAGPAFYLLATLALLFAHLYIYQLYRELLK